MAVFEKKALLPWEKEGKKEEGLKEEGQNEKPQPEPPKKRRRMGGYKEDPFVFFKGKKLFF